MPQLPCLLLTASRAAASTSFTFSSSSPQSAGAAAAAATSGVSYVFPPPPPVSIPVFASKSRFAVRRVYGIGLNYAAHQAEMNKANSSPVIFLKSTVDGVTPQADPDATVVIPYALNTSNYMHEVELVAAIGKDFPISASSSAPAMSKTQILDHIYGYAVGLDMTRRDLQKAAKESGAPWDLGKTVDFGAPISVIRRAADVGHPTKGAISLFVNNEERQRGDVSDMIWTVPEILSHLSKFYRLRAGDLVFTGTPAGVGPVKIGDSLDACVDGIGRLTVDIS